MSGRVPASSPGPCASTAPSRARPAPMRWDSCAASASPSGRMSSLLETADLHVAYGKVEAVRGVSLTMAEGQIAAVIGPNGAGKTTLLGALMGLLPSRGRIVHDGPDLRRLDVEQRVARGLCLV